MAELALAVDGQRVASEDIARPVRDKIRQAREWRRKNFEPTWHSNMAFASGRQWDVYDRNTRTLRKIQEVDPRYRGRELYTADIIKEYRMTVLGELASDTGPSELLLERDDQPSEDFQKQVNRGVQYAWDFEARADEAIGEVDQMIVDLGTAALRCRFDADVGPVKEDAVPHLNGKPILDQEQAHALMAAGPRQDVQMLPIREGRITLDPISPFQILVPPGVARERSFPWEAVERPTLLTDVQDEYGDVAADLKEDGDIGSSLGITAQSTVTDPVSYAVTDGRSGRLRDHVWLILYYERPSRKHQKGRVLHFASNELKLLRVDDELPYQAPDGTYRSGITYFHWWRVTGRFFSQSLVEAMKDGQRLLNKRRTQQNEIIDRGMPWVMVEEGSSASRKTGSPLELVYIKKDEKEPIINTGVGPGPWMQADIESVREDIVHATGVQDVRLGENPVNVKTFGQLASLNEAEQTKRSVILAARKRGLDKIVEDVVYDMRQWWGPEKLVMLAGDEEVAEAERFNATRIPPFFIVRQAKGPSKPKSQAAELQKVEDIFNAAVTTGAALHDPESWVAWKKDSYEAGQALDLPELPANEQRDKAQMENHLLMSGEEATVAYYDLIAVHLPEHRSAQDQALMAGDQEAWHRLEDHVQEHLQAAAENAAQVGAMQPPAPPMVPPEQQAQADEMHDHTARKASAEADLAEKKAQQSDFRPQPQGGQ